MVWNKHTGISQSAISLYRFCPYAYYLKYKKRCTPMFWDMSAMDTGRYAHDAIDKYYKFHYDAEESRDYILANTYEELKKIWDTSLDIENFKKAYQCLENHADWEYRNITDGLQTKPLTELKLSQKGYFGYLDYVHLQNWKPVDFKTGKHANLSYNYRLQAYVYKVLLEAEFGKPVNHFYFYFLHPNEWRTVSFGKDKQIKVGEDVENYKLRIEDEDFEHEPRLPNNCKNCEYKYYCKILGV